MNIGRNDTCPCGSGSKYKKCCDTELRPAGYSEKEIEVLKLNKWLAYRGKIGRERRAFCSDFIHNKQLVIQEINRKQKEEAQSQGKSVSCQPGCVYCCYHFVTATLDETEAIVYYLYQNPPALNAFLEAYRDWKIQAAANNSLITSISRAYNDYNRDRESSVKQDLFQSLTNQYTRLNIPCPFLAENRCLIYPVRPWVCAGFFAVTPPEWCRPDSPEPAVTLSLTSFKDMRKIPHYRSSRGIWMNMPRAVYGLLQGGIYTLSKIPGLESLENETIGDPEVQALLDQLRLG